MRTSGHQRPKIEEYGDSLFAVLHIVEPLHDEFHVGELEIFAGPNFVLSVRSPAREGLQRRAGAMRARAANLLQPGSGFILYALMDAVVDRYFPILDALEDELENDRGAHFRPRGRAARQHRGTLRTQAR